jgi:hypothetical protein
VEAALHADAERLEREVLRFREAVRDEEARSESWVRAVEAFGASSAAFDDDGNDDEGAQLPSHAATRDRRATALLDRQEAALRDEIEILRRVASQQELEIGRLQQLRRDQTEVLRDMRRARTDLEEERNDLEIQARAFDNDHCQLSRALVDAHDEVDRLSSPQIRLIPALFELTVDNDRGLRYPLINRLRLAYRPKGDIQWDEIQAAWSLAAQMLLAAATAFDFQSANWKIVPLSHCAKLIYTESADAAAQSASSTSSATPPAKTAAASSGRAPPPQKRRSMVFNLGHPLTDGSRALLAWNTLLHEVVRHAALELHRAAAAGDGSGRAAASTSTSTPPALPSAVPPFEISPHQVGDVVLLRLSAKDDAGWSRAVHCMSANLLWLSERASEHVRGAAALQAEGCRWTKQ